MSQSTPDDVTVLLHRWREGDRAAEGRLFDLVVPELRKLARSYMSRERSDHTWQATELIGQIYGRLVKARNQNWADRGHFFAIAARAMRFSLLDHARARPDAVRVDIEEMRELLPSGARLETAIAVNRLLDQLEQTRPDWCSIVEMKYFLGLTDAETAEYLGMSVSTVQHHWHDARGWLFDRLEGSQT